MCGIVAGDRDYNVARLAAEVGHRGIRASTKTVKSWAMTHVRLPIVGLDEEWDQPRAIHLEDEKDDRWTIGFVGEILDFKDDYPEAECDVHAVADIWLNEGPRGFAQRDGFWSIVAVDHERDQLHILTDYLNQKPLYYRTRPAPLVASELGPLVRIGELSYDEVYFSSIMKWGYCPETWRTPYREIRRTLPGEHTVFDRSNVLLREFTDVLFPLKMEPAELKEEIVQAVKRRVLSSDVPVAALVSGGLDSAIVYTLARRFSDKIHAYHVENGERAEAALVAGSLGNLDYVELESSPGMGRGMAYTGEPVDLGSLLPQVAVSDAIGSRGKERVCLTGDGADELFGGYGRSIRYDSQHSDVFHELVAWHLPRLDTVMMRNRIEVRSPFLARRVVQGALGLDWDPYRRDKTILREMFRFDLPEGVADQKKKPLRTAAVEIDPEVNRQLMIDLFKRRDRRG